jgi:hypothetical protein
MPFFFSFSILVQILCAVHCVRHRGNSLWLMVIIFLSIPGCLAYLFFEVLPAYSGRREVRAVGAAVTRRLDPDRQLRAAREALDLSDTAANRTALGDALAESGDWAEAVRHYREALAKTPGADRTARLKLGRALLESGDSAGARRELEALEPSGSPSENDRSTLLLARSLEECGDFERALSLYADIGQRLPGGEALCRHAALLVARGRGREALPLLAEVEARAKRLDRMERAKDSAMYDWAARTLAELKSA